MSSFQNLALKASQASPVANVGLDSYHSREGLSKRSGPCIIHTQLCHPALTLTVAPWWVVEGQAQGDDGSDLKDDEGDILQSLPHQLQKSLSLLGRDEVLSESCAALL